MSESGNPSSGSSRLDGLSAIVSRAVSAAGGQAPRSCLWVGRNDRVAASLSAHLASSGKECAVFACGTSGEVGRQPIDGAYRIDGMPVGSDCAPPLSAVLDFAVTRTDAPAVIASTGKAFQAFSNSHERTALDAIAEDFGLTTFDLVVIAGEQLLTDEIVKRVEGSKAIVIDGSRATYGGSAAFARLFAGTEYLLAASSDDEDGGWALFVQRDQANSNLPIHFFTIVVNGEPFIRYHEKMLLELDCPWHWHVVEGIASLVKDTAWSVSSGGHIPESLHHRGKSNDGTSEYLDELQARYPNRVTVYRKPDDIFWDGKLEMVSAPIPNITEPCLLWQIDGDELWTADQVHAVRKAFVEDPGRSAAYFWCNYFVGPEKGISTRLNYAQNPAQEWLRVWRFEPGMTWDKHEPPVLAGRDAAGNSYDVGQRNPFRHRETEAMGAVFDHFAYVTSEQAQFKESYYGYKNAVKQWRELQEHRNGSGHLRDYFAWVNDETMFDTVDRMGWAPLAFVDKDSGRWQFRSATDLERLRAGWSEQRKPRIVVDGVFFQLASSGIARVWMNLLREWVRTGYADNVVVLDRAGTTPRLDGVLYRTIDAHNWDTIDGDATYLQEICDLEQADLFVSTYYTTPIRTPSVFFGHDMIPERLGFDLDDLWWRQKRRAINFAAGHVMVSQSSRDDMCELFPDIAPDRVLVAHNSVDEAFRPCDDAQVKAFRAKHAISRPFVMVVGERFGWKGYKNGGVVFAALSQIPKSGRPLLVCVGGRPELEDIGKSLLDEDDVFLLKLDDEELRCCFAAALAFICPSLLEGFGLPVVEAMTVGCPALVCHNSSIPEVAGDAGVYFDPNDPLSLVSAIESVSNSDLRAAVIEKGKGQAASFSQAKSAVSIADYFERVVSDLRSGTVPSQALAMADSFRDAEARRAAQVTADRLQGELHAIKHQIASTTRIAPLADSRPAMIEQTSVAALVAAQDNSLMIALERRLAAAYSQLRSQQETTRFVEPASIPPAPDFVESARLATQPDGKPEPFERQMPVSAIGLSDVEGPYPEAGVRQRFRWQVEPVCVLGFAGGQSGKAILEFDFCNLEPDQALTVRHGSNVIGTVRPPEAGWDQEWHVAFPVDLGTGPVEIMIEAERSAICDADSKPRFIAMLGACLSIGEVQA